MLVVVSGDASGSTQSDASGEYSIVSLQPGDVTITMTRTGYFPVVANGTAARDHVCSFGPSADPGQSG